MPAEQKRSPARAVARGVLFIPRLLVQAVLLPLRGTVYLYDRYELKELYERTFFNVDLTFGLVPTIQYATSFGIMAGARLTATDLFGREEHMTVEGAYGGKYQALAEASLDTGVRLDPVVLTVGGNFYRFARLPFYGIGNNDDVSEVPPPQRVDPFVNDFAFETRYRYQELRGFVAADWRIIDDLRVIAQGAITNLKTSPSTSNTPIDAIYDPASLVSFEDSVTHLYGQLALRWDTRGIRQPRWETTPYTAGWLVSGFIGGVHQLEDDLDDFARYGIDMQVFLPFAVGPRMLVLRLQGQGVTGDLADIPFTELPYLGGDILRGYDGQRFRDRVAAVGTAQYVWELSRYLNAFLFVDAGRVYPSLDDLTFDNMRVGFGGGLELHREHGFLISGTLASSRDGGLFVTANLNPIWNEVPRWR